jgi:hypothetical protein
VAPKRSRNKKTPVNDDDDDMLDVFENPTTSTIVVLGVVRVRAEVQPRKRIVTRKIKWTVATNSRRLKRVRHQYPGKPRLLPPLKDQGSNKSS